jgi:tetratricopeptide (TPR) repeat protein
MDYLESAQHAFQARQFLEAERFYKQALKSLDPKQAEPVLSRLYEIAKNLRPDNSHREFEHWLRALANFNRWEDVLMHTPETSKHGFTYELRAEALFRRGQYGVSRTVAFAHGALLQDKNSYPALLQFSRLYQERFPHTLAFKFQEISALLALNAVDALEPRVSLLIRDIVRSWGRWEDVTRTTRVELLDTLAETLSHPGRPSGRIVLLVHQTKLTLLNLSGGQFRPEDWKRLVEILIYRAGWSEYALALECALSQNDDELAVLIREHVRSLQGFSYVKLSQGRPAIRRWWKGSQVQALSRVPSEEEEFEDSQSVVYIPQRPATQVSFEDEGATEENAIRHLRLSPPSGEMIPDLIVTYLMMEFGRVVDWLVDFALSCGDENHLHKKVRYLGAMRAIRSGEHHRALAFLSQMTIDPAMTIEELQEIKYAQGAVWKLLGNEEMARALFAEVERIAPGYRRLRERT